MNEYQKGERILDVQDLELGFNTYAGQVQALRGVSFHLNKGETLAIVGESGSGKSVTAKSIIGINAANTIIEGGEIIYDCRILYRQPAAVSRPAEHERRAHTRRGICRAGARKVSRRTDLQHRRHTGLAALRQGTRGS